MTTKAFEERFEIKARGLMSIAEKDLLFKQIFEACTIEGDHWLFPTTESQKYAKMRINGKTRTVSRFMLAYHTRENMDNIRDEDGNEVDACHTQWCPYHNCVNPDHLFWASRSKNTAM